MKLTFFQCTYFNVKCYVFQLKKTLLLIVRRVNSFWEIASNLVISRCSVQQIHRQYFERQDFSYRSKSRRKPKLSQREERKLVTESKKYQGKTTNRI